MIDWSILFLLSCSPFPIHQKLHVSVVTFQFVPTLEAGGAVYVIDLRKYLVEHLKASEDVQEDDVVDDLVDLLVGSASELHVSHGVVDAEAEEWHCSEDQADFVEDDLGRLPIAVDHHDPEVAGHGEEHEGVVDPVEDVEPLQGGGVGVEDGNIAGDRDDLHDLG